MLAWAISRARQRSPLRSEPSARARTPCQRTDSRGCASGRAGVRRGMRRAQRKHKQAYEDWATPIHMRGASSMGVAQTTSSQELNQIKRSLQHVCGHCARLLTLHGGRPNRSSTQGFRTTSTHTFGTRYERHCTPTFRFHACRNRLALDDLWRLRGEGGEGKVHANALQHAACESQ